MDTSPLLSANSPGTPSPLPPPPRPIRGGVGFSGNFLRLVSLAVATAALAALFYLALTILWVYHGTDTPGRAVGTHVSHGRNSSCYIDFTYLAADGQRRDDQSVSYSQYLDATHRLQSGAFAVQVRFLLFGPFHIAGLPAYGALSSKPTTAGFLALIGSGLAILLTRSAWVLPARERFLVRMGIPLLGAITDKRKTTGKSTTCYIKYFYKDAAGAGRERQMVVPDIQRWNAVQIGDVVTVLVHPAKPRLSTVYELDRYRVDRADIA